MAALPACPSCGSPAVQPVLDLGEQPLANRLLREADLDLAEPRHPLRLAVCTRCWLPQITDLVPPEEMFSEYPYFSSVSDAMVRHARDLARWVYADEQLHSGSLVVEIASNDGYLLQHYMDLGVPALGIEPAKNVAAVARQRGIETHEAFFGGEIAREITITHGQADVIHANNVFAHVPDPNGFVAALGTLLAPRGVAVLEFPYGVEMIERVEFDTIYHEHVFYFTLESLLPLFARHALDIHRVDRLPIHGGSLRLHISHRGSRERHESVERLVAEEAAKGVARPDFYAHFSRAVEALRDELRSLVARLRGEGARLAAYGASAKGSTLLNYVGIGGELEFVIDRSPHKQGLFTPGTHLPIYGPERLAEDRPDYLLLLTWNFADEILEQQRVYREAGGRFIIPLPRLLIA